MNASGNIDAILVREWNDRLIVDDDSKASFVPTLLYNHRNTIPNIISNTNNSIEQLETILTEYHSIIPLVVTNESIQTLLSEIHNNQIVWNCYDKSDNELTKLLQNSVLS